MSEGAVDKKIIQKKDEVSVVEESAVENVFKKIIYITPKTEGVDYNGILAKLAQYINIADSLVHVEKAAKYVVQIPAKYKDAFEAGKVFINQNSKTGVMWPTLYETLDSGKRRFVDNLPIKQEEMLRNNPFESVADSFHNIYMQQQISELSERMALTYETVKRIEQGQLDDRIGLLCSGRNQIIYALEIAKENRQYEIALGRSNMITAQQQILQSFRRRVEAFEAIPDNKWNRFWLVVRHSEYLKQKDKEFLNLQEYYKLFLQATQMIAASYVLCGEIETAKKVFEDAEQEMREIDFSSLKTLSYIHNKNTDMLYYHADEYVATERQICMDAAQKYDALSVEVSGEKLLEVFDNGRAEKIRESESGQ